MLLQKHGLLFVHIPKNAGCSIETAFQGELRQHRTIHAYQADEFRELHSFAVIRNPWDRFVSMYLYIQREPCHRGHPIQSRGGIQIPFSMWLHENLNNRQPDFMPCHTDGQRHLHNQIGSPFWFSSQLAWIAEASGRILVHTLLRFERLNEDFRRLCADLHVDLKLPHQNRAPFRKPYRAYYTDQLAELVAVQYGGEINAFGYRF